MIYFIAFYYLEYQGLDIPASLVICFKFQVLTGWESWNLYKVKYTTFCEWSATLIHLFKKVSTWVYSYTIANIGVAQILRTLYMFKS